MINRFLIIYFKIIIAGLFLIPAENSYAQIDSIQNPQIYYYPNGNVASEGILNEGKPHGTWITYFPNGTIKSKGDWVNGKLNGYWEFFFANGNREKSLYYINGEKHGLSIEYQLIYEKGKYVEYPLAKEIFELGIRIGKGFYYSKKGCLENIIPFKNGDFDGKGLVLDCDSNFLELHYYREGKLLEKEQINQKDSLGNYQGRWLWFNKSHDIKEEISYRNGVKHGWHRVYKSNGDIEFSLLYQDGEMHLSQSSVGFDYIEYTDSLGRKFNGTFFQNIPIGIHIQIDTETSNCIEYDTKGNILGKGSCTEKGVKEKEWIYVNEKGVVTRKGLYNKGLENGKWEFFHDNGKLEQYGNYVNGKEHGQWYWYYNNGKKRKEEEFFYGVREGDYQEFDSSGNAIVKGYFSDNLEEGEWEIRVGDIIWKGIYNFGELNGRVESQYLDGNIYFTGEFINGYQDGRHKYFYPNGQLKEEQIWDVGERIGTWRKYDYLGGLIISITYRNGEEYLINGIKVKV